jgi:ABC-type oligopeptide transport system ATPase subunit
MLGDRPVLTLEHVSKTFRTGAFGSKSLRAVDDVTFTVEPGEVLSLIGESGSGKSTIGRMILGLTCATAGRISFDGRDVTPTKDYYRRAQGVFQDPFSSFNPVFKADHVFATVREGFFPHESSRAWRAKLEKALDEVALRPDDVLGKFPHQLSGGELQRVLVARALLLDIELLIADEIISMLDASTRIDVLNLLGDLKERGLAIVFITHDLSLGNYISDQTIILRHGRVVESGPTPRVFGDPQHEYTQALLSAVPQLHWRWQ